MPRAPRRATAYAVATPLPGGAAKGVADMGDRFGRRNRMVDEAVDVDGAVVRPPDPDPTDAELDVAADATGSADASDPAPAEAPPHEGDDEVEGDVEDVDGRFARRNPIVDRAIGGSTPGTP